MAITITISQKELKRQAGLALEGKAYEVFLAFNDTTGLTAESTYSAWQAEEITGDASYAPVTGTLATGAYDAGDARYELPAVTATFTAAAAGTGYTYDTVCIRIATETYLYGIITESPAVQLAPGQSKTYTIQLAQDD